MKKIVRILTIALMLSAALPAGAQEVRHGSDDFKIGVAGYSYRKFNLDQTLQFLQDMATEPVRLEPVFLNKRGHCNENPKLRNQRVAPTHCN